MNKMYIKRQVYMYLSWNSDFIVSVIAIKAEWRFKVCVSCAGITWDYFNKWVLRRDNGIHLFCIHVSNLENKWLKHEIAGECERVWKLACSPCFKCLIVFWLVVCFRVFGSSFGIEWCSVCVSRCVSVLLLLTVLILPMWVFYLSPLSSWLFYAFPSLRFVARCMPA